LNEVVELFGNDVVLDGEISIENGTVHDINKSVNWDKAKFFLFDMVKPTFNYTQRNMLLLNFLKDKEIRYVTTPRKFSTLEEGWNFVKANNLEGLVLKEKYSPYPSNDNVLDEIHTNMWLKVKNLKEKVICFNGYEKHTRGCVLIANGFLRINFNNLDLTDVATKEIDTKGCVFGTVCYLREMESGKFREPYVKELVIDGKVLR
jgi:hypothetical protein